VNLIKNANHLSLKYQQGFLGKTPVFAPEFESEQLLAHALDEIACGVIIVDQFGQIQHCNLAGKMILQRGQLLSEKADHICGHDAKDQESLQEALSHAMHGKRGMLTLGQESQSTVAVVPLDRQSYAGASLPHQPSKGSIALIFSRSGTCETLMLSFFARASANTLRRANFELHLRGPHRTRDG
jgi:nitrogen-specific signal transduction histidine kinase